MIAALADGRFELYKTLKHDLSLKTIYIFCRRQRELARMRKQMIEEMRRGR